MQNHLSSSLPASKSARQPSVGRPADMSAKRTIASFFAPRSPKKSKVEDAAVAKACEHTSYDGENVSPQKATSPTSGASNLTEAQQLRIASSKNMALSKMAVKKAKSEGRLPHLKELMVDTAWQEQIGQEFAKAYIDQLEKFVHQEWAGQKPVYPPKEHVFRAYNTVPFDKIKVVILGQDPYHGHGLAEGLCFSVPREQKRPSSLLNIYKELAEDCDCRIATHGNLQSWASQGVFMLNTVLTVRAQQANSHARKGWEGFTDVTIKHISLHREGVVFLLWGKQAQDKERLIDSKKHHILKSSHPSGLSAYRGFLGCRHFSKTNELLKEQGLEPINWQV